MTNQNASKSKGESQEKKQRVVSDASRAAFLFNKLNQLDEEEQAELQESPQEIKNKYTARRDALLAEENETVLVLVRKMRE